MKKAAQGGVGILIQEEKILLIKKIFKTDLILRLLIKISIEIDNKLNTNLIVTHNYKLILFSPSIHINKNK